MMKFKIWNIALLLPLCFISCTQEGIFQQSKDNSGHSPILFTSEVEGVSVTRANGATWSTNDSIGVFMKKSGETLSDASSENGAVNVSYTTANGDGKFSPSGSGIYYPKSEDLVDFIAYYPQRTLSNPYIYPIDLSNQNNIAAIDLLYSNNLTNISDRSNALNLGFTHQLSRLVFNVKSTNSNRLGNLKLQLSGVKSKASFSLADGTLTVDPSSVATIDANATITGSTATAQAVLLPENSISKITLIINVNDSIRKCDLALTSLEKGKEYSFNLNIDNVKVVIDPEVSSYSKWTETPMITQSMAKDTDLIYLNHYMPNTMTDPVSGGKMRNYSILFSKKNKIAYWVAYPLFPACTGSTSRTDAWNYDPNVLQIYQGNLFSGYGGNGYDRGHQIPSADRTCDTETNKTTFYFTNMTPQVGVGLNQSIWADLEDKVRSWRDGTDTVYVVTGAIPPKTNLQYMKTMAVPSYYFKAVARRVNGVFTTIAFKLDNKTYTTRDFMSDAISVKDLEDLTGFTFFPSIDASTKATLDKSQWQ